MLRSIALSILTLATAVLADTTSYDSTTTVTVTPEVTYTTTVGYIEDIYETVYIYTNSQSHLTTTTVIGSSVYHLASGTPTGKLAAVSSPATDNKKDILVSLLSASGSLQLSALVSPSPSAVLLSASLSSSESVNAVLLSASVLPSLSSSQLLMSASALPFSSSSELLLFPAMSSMAAIEHAVTQNHSSIPDGDYSTSTSTTTTLKDGTSAILEYVILYTLAC